MRPEATWTIALLTTLSLLLGTGCGGGTSDEAAIRKLNLELADAVNVKDSRKLYGLIDAETRKDCPLENFMVFSLFATLFSRQKVEVAEVRDILVKGRKASAVTVLSVGGTPQKPETNSYVKEGSAWKLEFTGEGCAR